MLSQVIMGILFILFKERQQMHSLHHVWYSFSQVCHFFIRCVCVVGESENKEKDTKKREIQWDKLNQWEWNTWGFHQRCQLHIFMLIWLRWAVFPCFLEMSVEMFFFNTSGNQKAWASHKPQACSVTKALLCEKKQAKGKNVVTFKISFYWSKAV